SSPAAALPGAVTSSVNLPAADAALELRSGRRTLPAWFCESAAARGAGTALRWKRLGIWESVSWREYAERARAVGCALLAAGCRRGDRVAVLSDNRPEWCYVEFGAQGVGVAAVGVYATSSPRQAEHVLADSAARILFVQGDEQLDKALAVIDRLPALEKVVYFDARGLHNFAHAK